MTNRRFPVRPLRVVALLLAALPASGQSFPELGARALGMGGAYVAVADGPTAIYWNPAGMPLRPAGTSFVWGRTTNDPEGLAGRLDDLAATGADRADIVDRPADALRAAELLGAIGSEPDPVSGHQPIGFFYGGRTFGLGYYRLELAQASPIVDRVHIEPTTDPGVGLPFNTSSLAATSLKMQELVATLAGSFGDPRLLVGINGRWTRGETRSAAPSLFGFPDFRSTDVFDAADDADARTSNAFSFDVGALITVHPRVRLGVVGKYLTKPELETADGGRFELEPRWRSGIAIFPSEALTISADLDLTAKGFASSGAETRHAAFGAQLALGDGTVALRGGLRESLEGPATRLVTAGIGVVARDMVLDLALGYAPRTGSATIAVEIGYRRRARER